MKRCTGCGRDYRGKGTIAIVAREGKPTRARVCPTCAKRGVVIVLGGAAAAPLACGHAADVCSICRPSRDKAADVAAVAKALEGRAKVYASTRVVTAGQTGDRPDPYSEGLAEGLRSAAAFLRSGRWGA